MDKPLISHEGLKSVNVKGEEVRLLQLLPATPEAAEKYKYVVLDSLRGVAGTIRAAQRAEQSGDLDPGAIYDVQIARCGEEVSRLIQEIGELRSLRSHDHDRDEYEFCRVCHSDALL